MLKKGIKFSHTVILTPTLIGDPPKMYGRDQFRKKATLHGRANKKVDPSGLAAVAATHLRLVVNLEFGDFWWIFEKSSLIKKMQFLNLSQIVLTQFSSFQGCQIYERSIAIDRKLTQLFLFRFYLILMNKFFDLVSTLTAHVNTRSL